MAAFQIAHKRAKDAEEMVLRAEAVEAAFSQCRQRWPARSNAPCKRRFERNSPETIRRLPAASRFNLLVPC
jgi:hypothetical protein